MTATLRQKLLCWVLPAFALLLLYEILLTEASMRSVRVEEIPFSLSGGGAADAARQRGSQSADAAKGIIAVARLEQQRGFLHLFHVPYIICFFAAKGKWPFIPAFMQMRVDAAAKSFFSKNDSVIRQVCQKWIQVKECFRPIFAPTTTVSSVVESIAPVRAAVCTSEPMVYFDRNHIGNVSADTIHTTIEFLESFLPPTPTKKTKKKIRVRGRIDEMDID